MPEEIDYTMYASNPYYEKAVADHIAKILDLQEMASKNNKRKFRSSKNNSIGNMLRKWEHIFCNWQNSTSEYQNVLSALKMLV